MKKEDQHIWVLLDKFCDENAALSFGELRQLYFLLGSREEEGPVSEWMQQRWEENRDGRGEEPDYDRIFARVEQQLLFETRRRKRFVRFFQRTAAVLLLPLLGLSGYLLYDAVRAGKPLQREIVVPVAAEQEYLTPPGMRSKIILPDSTAVWLNASSRLTVAEGFGGAHRHVTLEGEAYFEVTKSDRQSFTVGTQRLDIKVWGTAFNLSAYPGDLPTAVLVEGSIEANIRNRNSRSSKQVLLQPEQRLRVQPQSREVNVESHVDTRLYTSWTNGQLVFHKTPMEEVAKTMERWYNVRIHLHDPLLKTYHITGTFDNRSLEQVLDYLALSSSVQYKIDRENDRVTIYTKTIFTP